jgi:hypothetical protein
MPTREQILGLALIERRNVYSPRGIYGWKESPASTETPTWLKLQFLGQSIHLEKQHIKHPWLESCGLWITWLFPLEPEAGYLTHGGKHSTQKGV